MSNSSKEHLMPELSYTDRRERYFRRLSSRAYLSGDQWRQDQLRVLQASKDAALQINRIKRGQAIVNRYYSGLIEAN